MILEVAMVQRRGGCVIDLEKEAKTGHRCQDDLGLGEKDAAGGAGVAPGGCNVSLEECRCSCHRTPGEVHIAACCFKCPYCGKNIAMIFEDHTNRCPMKTDVDPDAAALNRILLDGLLKRQS